MSMTTRVLGAATAAYGLATILSPKVLAKPCGLVEPDGEVSQPVRTLVAAIGARDTVVGLAMLSASTGRELRTAVAVRVLFDLADAVVFGTTLPDRGARKKAAVAAGAWAGLCAASSWMP